MAFWVNEDKPLNKATVHRDDCSSGVPRRKLERDGRWHGPFDSKDAASSTARRTGRRTVAECLVCEP